MSSQRLRPLTPPDTADPLVICDRLLRLAQDADRAGLAVTAEHLVHLASGVFEERIPLGRG